MKPSRIKRWIDLQAAALISATIFLILEMSVMPLLKGAGPWRALHMIAGIALDTDAVPPPEEPAPFSLHVLAAALLVHFTLSMIYSTVGSIVFRWLRLRWAIPIGLALGLLLYVINFHGFAQQFAWFKEARGWEAIIVNLIYGFAAAVTQTNADLECSLHQFVPNRSVSDRALRRAPDGGPARSWRHIPQVCSRQRPPSGLSNKKPVFQPLNRCKWAA